MQAETIVRGLDLLLAASFQEVLESMCFTMVDGPAIPPDEYPAPSLEVKLHFRGSREGSFWLLFPRQTAEEIASAFSGAESPGLEKTADVIRELANIICGATLSRLSQDGLFDLDPPRATWKDGQPSGLPSSQAFRVDLQIGAEVVSAALAFREDA